MSSKDPSSTQVTVTSTRVPVIVLDERKDGGTTNLSSSPSSSSSNHPIQQYKNSSPSTSSSPSTQKQHNATSSQDSEIPRTSVSSSSPNKTINVDNKNGNVPSSTTTTPAPNNNSSSSTTTPKINIHPSKLQISTRSSSDIGIPASSMPNIALTQISIMGVGGADVGGGAEVVGGGSGCGENYLGVYCSPRTTRRSVDLDMKETVPGQYDWMESLDTSANSLKVLTASSRVGSALSLNSECTTRSIGLLSNDSDSEEFSQSENKPSGQGQLRRYMSYPEEAQIPESNTRPSQSLSNLKSANHSPSMSRGDRYLQRQSLDYADLGESTSTIIVPEENASDVRVRKTTKILSKENNVVEDKYEDTIVSESSKGPLVENVSGAGEGALLDSVSSSGDKIRKPQDSTHKTGNVLSKRSVIGSVRNANNHNMLCYKCDTNSPSREGRIRQWLQDMDTTHNDDVIQ